MDRAGGLESDNRVLFQGVERPLMKILVTGAAGFIGSTLVDRLLSESHEVVGIDNLDDFYAATRKRANLSGAMGNPRFRFEEGDIRDRDAMHRLFQETTPEAVVHLAARAGVRPSLEQPGLYADVNVVGTSNLLDAASRMSPLPRFVYASSSSVYGNREEAPFRESDDVNMPFSPYAATKRACELLAHTFHQVYGLPVSGLRFFTAYGPRNRPDLAISKFASLIERNQPVPMFGDGSTRRDYTYIDDIVDGVVRAVENCRGEHIYNLGNSDPVTLTEMIAALGEALGIEPRIERLPEQPGDVRQTYADITRASAELGYRPRTPFTEGLRRFVAWRRAEGLA